MCDQKASANEDQKNRLKQDTYFVKKLRDLRQRNAESVSVLFTEMSMN